MVLQITSQRLMLVLCFFLKIFKIEFVSDINLDEELLEVEKIRTAVHTWIDGLESLVKETMCSLKEQLENANSTDRDQPHSGRVLDFNSVRFLKNFLSSLVSLESTAFRLSFQN